MFCFLELGVVDRAECLYLAGSDDGINMLKHWAELVESVDLMKKMSGGTEEVSTGVVFRGVPGLVEERRFLSQCSMMGSNYRNEGDFRPIFLHAEEKELLEMSGCWPYSRIIEELRYHKGVERFAMDMVNSGVSVSFSFLAAKQSFLMYFLFLKKRVC